MGTWGLRAKILWFVGALVAASFLGSVFTLSRLQGVHRTVDELGRIGIPLSRQLVQLQSDTELYRRELERRLDPLSWNVPSSSPRVAPRWMEDLIESGIKKVQDLTQFEQAAAGDWADWLATVRRGLNQVRERNLAMVTAAQKGELAQAATLSAGVRESLEAWSREIAWGTSEVERSVRGSFQATESKISELRTSLRMILLAVVGLSLLVLWLSEKALRPLTRLSQWARAIADGGLKRGASSTLGDLFVGRNDEVGALAREFGRMSSALLEREKHVELQRTQLEDQNRLLKEIGNLNQSILLSLKDVLIVTDADGMIRHANAAAESCLGKPSTGLQGSLWTEWSDLREIFEKSSWFSSRQERVELDDFSVGAGVYRGEILRLRSDQGELAGTIIVLRERSEAIALEQRLQSAEKLATVGKMSAQVAHEVRNPLHSIGLEAELALEALSRGDQSASAKAVVSLRGILDAVERVEKVTANYLKLSRLSAGTKCTFFLSDVIERVLVNYSPLCQKHGIRVDWRGLEASFKLHGDPDLLELAIGNLISNAVQALVEHPLAEGQIPMLSVEIVSTDEGVQIVVEDNGPGVSQSILPRLFEPFATGRAQGTGLGLSFCKRLAEEHGGALEYMTSDLGGAKFQMNLKGAT
jgi:nitrogen fixation/metabolism regulation signal transduction histidine kinase